MSHPSDAPAAAWYPDPQTPGQVRWWDGAKWTEHVSVPAQPVERVVAPVEPAGSVEPVEPVEPVAPIEPVQAAGYGRHAAGRPPVPQSVSDIQHLHEQERVQVRADSLSYA